jgi:hypothetical protein
MQRLFALALLLTVPAFSQKPWQQARDLVQKTTQDLQEASKRGMGSPKEAKKEQGRYSKAYRNLSDFDRDLVKQKFNRGKLNDSIEAINDVYKNNTLSPEDRDRLSADVKDLRTLRDGWK